MRFFRALDLLAREDERMSGLGLVTLELLQLPIALVAHRLAARPLGDEACLTLYP
ncbi:MAG: hypothetical protein RL385_2475 [Pseudomonadota bacterium]